MKTEDNMIGYYRYQDYLENDRVGTYALSRIIDRYIAVIMKDSADVCLSSSQENLLMDLHIARDIIEMSCGFVDTFNVFSPFHFRQVLERIAQIKITTEYERLYIYQFILKFECLMSEVSQDAGPEVLNHYRILSKSSAEVSANMS